MPSNLHIEQVTRRYRAFGAGNLELALVDNADEGTGLHRPLEIFA